MKIWFRKTAKKLLIVLAVLSAVNFLFFLGAHVYIQCACDATASFGTPPEDKEYVTNRMVQYKEHSYWLFRSDDKVSYSMRSLRIAHPLARVKEGYSIMGSLFSWLRNDYIYPYEDDPEIKMLDSTYSVLFDPNDLYVREDVDVSLKVENISYIEVEFYHRDDYVLKTYEEPEEIQYWIDKLDNQEEWEGDLFDRYDRDVCVIHAYFKEVPQLRCRFGLIETKGIPEVVFSKNAAAQ